MYKLVSKIIDQDGFPVEGANVQAINTLGAVVGNPVPTDKSGRFSLIAPESKSLVRVSHVGYDDLIVTAGKFGPQQTLVFGKMLDEVPVGGSPGKTNSSGSAIWWLLGLGALAAVGYATMSKGEKPKSKRLGRKPKAKKADTKTGAAKRKAKKVTV